MPTVQMPDPTEFDRIFLEERPKLLVEIIASGATPEEADELMNEVYVKAREKLPEALREHIRDTLQKVRETRRKRFLREARRRSRRPITDVPSSEPGPAQAAENAELRAKVFEMLDRLGGRRTVIWWHFLEGYTVTEAAEKLGISERTAYRRLRAELAALGGRLRRRAGPPGIGRRHFRVCV